MSMLDVFVRAMLPIAGRTGLGFLSDASRTLVTQFGASLCLVLERGRDQAFRPVVAFAGDGFVELPGPPAELDVFEARCRDALGAPSDLTWHVRTASGTAVCILAGVTLDEALAAALSLVATRCPAEIAHSKSERRASLESRLGLMRDATDELVWHWHIATGRVEWSDASLAQGAMSFDEWRQRIHRSDQDRVGAALEEMREGARDRWDDRCRYTRGDGTTRVAEIRAVVERRQDGKPIRVIGSFHDITEASAHEQRLILAERMEAMGTLAAGIAHEINNPLAYVKGNIEHVLEELRAAPGIEPDLAAALDEAREGAERVRRIVQDLRLFSRPENEGHAPVDVDRLVEGALVFVGNDVVRRARLETVLRKPPPVDANETRLGHVVLALIVNAIQALPEGSPESHVVGVETGVNEAGRVFVLVRDTGPGIPSEILGRIFDPFFTTKRVGDGAGLGLSIAHSIVASLGGEITVDSTPGIGTTFRVTLAVHS